VLGRALVAVLVLLCACTGDDPEVVAPRRSITSSDSIPSVTPTAVPAAPNATRNPVAPGVVELTRSPRKIADALVSLRRDLLADVESWVGEGARPNTRLGRRVNIQALGEQTMLRRLITDPKLAEKVTRRLPPGVRRRVERHLAVGGRLRALIDPVRPPIELLTTEPLPPQELLAVFKRAGRRHGIDWEVLAAVNFVESRFGRAIGSSSAGAIGPMQFLPSTWEIYGRGDIRDPHDAIPAAARLLDASGAPEDMRAALFAYNHSDAYVDAIMTYARDMKLDTRNYYIYWSWEVFVLTTGGDVQLTGPGGRRP
jgi:Transglycosylase SLT domain